MSAIIGGSVTYGRTTKPADYESKKAEVTLNFGIEQETPAEDRNAFIVAVGNMAIHHCNRMLGLNEQPAAYVPVAEVVPEPVPEAAKRARRTKAQIEADEAAQAPVVTENPFGGSTAPGAGDAAEIEMNKGGFGEQTAGPTPASSAAFSADAPTAEGFVFGAEPAATEITDVDLMTALNRKAAELGGAKEINVLLGLYIAKGANPREIPQEKRPEFIEKIHGLKAN